MVRRSCHCHCQMIHIIPAVVIRYLMSWLLSHVACLLFFAILRRRSMFSLVKALLRKKGRSYCAICPSLHSMRSYGNNEGSGSDLNYTLSYTAWSTCSPLLSIWHFRGRALRSRSLIKMVLLRDTGWKHDGQRQLSRSQTVGYLHHDGRSCETMDRNAILLNNKIQLVPDVVSKRYVDGSTLGIE